MRSRSGRSIGRSSSVRAGSSGPDIYLFPAVVGGGLGDIEETLAAGRRLEPSGLPLFLYRRPGRPLPRAVDGPWAWPLRLRRIKELAPASRSAVTVVPAWGVSAAPERPGALGRAGPWADEAREVEERYGAESTLHVSLEEFARTLSVARENRERFREGGVAARAIGARTRAAGAAAAIEGYRAAFDRFRAFDRPNVLHLFSTFRRDAGFAREHPAAVQCGPLWPHRYRREEASRAARRHWIWYASPSSAERIAFAVAEGLAGAEPPVRLIVRTPRAWAPVADTSGVEVSSVPLPHRIWSATFRSADLRIVTGSRTLLEALEVGGPFLYFNGVLGSGRRARRHRPEKLIALLGAYRSRLPPDLRRDLAAFARGQRVRPIVRRAVRREGGWRRFPSRWPTTGFRAPFDDAGALLLAVARALGRSPDGARRIVARVRAGSNP